jgi:hypothetical protein
MHSGKEDNIQYLFAKEKMFELLQYDQQNLSREKQHID